MMKRTYMFIMILLFGYLLWTNERVYAMETMGFVTEEMSTDEIETFLNNVNISRVDREPSKEPIKCFDVNENGMIAIGTENGRDKMVCVYSDVGIFQYGYRFKTDGSFGVELNDEILMLYFVRSDVSISIDSMEGVQSVSRICDVSENNTYWNKSVRAINRNVGEYEYVLKNDVGILGIFMSTYSQLCKIDEFDNATIIYDANSIQLCHVLILFVGVIVLVCIAVFVIINEFKKLQKNNANQHNVKVCG